MMKRFAYIDIEANHDNWSNAEIIEVAILVLNEDGKVVDHFHSLVSPKRELNPEINKLTGISTQMLNSAPEFNKIAPTILEKINDTVLVAHKAEFDYQLLSQAFKEINIPIKCKTICTLKLSQRLIPGLNSYSLNSMAKLLFIKHKNNHRAQDDVETLAKLHHHLRLLNGEIKLFEDYLGPHKQLINKSKICPGLIIFNYKDKQEVIKSDNVQASLKELLILKPKNKERIINHKNIKLEYAQTLIETFLKLDRYQQEKLPYCIYSFYNKHKKLILRVGRTHTKRHAHFYFSSKTQAIKALNIIVKKVPKSNYVYQDSPMDRSEIIAQNKIILNEIKKRGQLQKNILIKSNRPNNDQFQYIILKTNRTFGLIQSSKPSLNSDDIKTMQINYKKLSPEKYMNILQGLNWIKNQKNKTESIRELKANI
jgi:DNA polymerase-3 subunit epsilon